MSIRPEMTPAATTPTSVSDKAPVPVREYSQLIQIQNRIFAITGDQFMH